MIRYIFWDIEGCLMHSGGRFQTAPTDDLAALRKIVDTIHSHTPLKIGLCSGRQTAYGELMAQLLGIMSPGEWSVLENGAVLYHHADGQLIPHPVLNQRVRDTILSARSQMVDYVQGRGGVLEASKDICMSFNPPPDVSIEDWHDELVGFIREALNLGVDELEIGNSRSAVDVTPAGINKASAIEHFSTLYGYQLEEIAYIGDTEGDHAAMKIVGLPMGPINATPVTQALIRSRGGYVAHRSEVLGVMELLLYVTNDPSVQRCIRYYL